MWRCLSYVALLVACGRDLGPRLPAPPPDDVPAAWRLQRFPEAPTFERPDGAVVDVAIGTDALWLAVAEFGDGAPPYRLERLARDGTRTPTALRTTAPPRLVPQQGGGVLVLSNERDDRLALVTATAVAADGAIGAPATLVLDGLDAEVSTLHVVPGTDGVGAAVLFASVQVDGEVYRASCELATLGAGGEVTRRPLGDAASDRESCSPRGLVNRKRERAVMFASGAQTVVMVLDAAGAPRWTQRVERASGVQWHGLAATDDTIAVVSSYTEQAPSWVAPAGASPPVKSVHVHALGPGDGTLGWDYDLPLVGRFGHASAQLVAAGGALVLVSRFGDADGTIHGERVTYADADVVALDGTTGAPAWHRVLRGDRGGSGYPALTRFDLIGGARGEVIAFGAYRRGLELGGVTARAPGRHASTDWTGKRHYDEPQVGFVARLR